MTSQKFSDLCRKLLDIDPQQDAIRYAGQWHSWGWVQNVALNLQELFAECGLSNAPVTFIPRNRPSALAGFLGLLTQERTVRMVYAFQSPTAIAASIEKLDSPAVVFMAEDLTPEIQAVLEKCGMTGICLDEGGARIVARGRRSGEGADGSPVTIDILTSGTTGPPKQFAIRQQVFAHMILNQNSGVLDDAAAPPLLLAFPIGNIAGISLLTGTFLQGRRVVLLDRFSIEAWRDFVVEFRPTTCSLPASAMPMILNAGISREDLSSLHSIMTGAAPLDIAIQKQFQDHYGIRVLLMYGATEFGGPVAAMTPELDAEWGDAKMGSSGHPLPGVSLRVRDQETGELLPPGEVGLLEVVSPRMGPEWIKTSDLVRIDEDGFLYCIGRADGAIMRGGFKVLPETVEQVLRSHPAVAVAGVIGVADPVLHQVPAAAIELRPGFAAPSFDELNMHVRAQLPSTHVPVYWTFVSPMPLNSAYKIDRVTLRELLESTRLSLGSAQGGRTH